ncbi:MAG: hypothetical protein MZU91_02935 [Desulfosudis oleivorans]|nr:hypothetical protein [Desulfosudis oleivorans]
MKEQVLARRDILRAELMTRMRARPKFYRGQEHTTTISHHLEKGIERINENIKSRREAGWTRRGKNS